MKNTIEQKTNNNFIHESSADEHRRRSERLAARGVQLGKAHFLVPLVGLAVLASVAMVQA